MIQRVTALRLALVAALALNVAGLGACSRENDEAGNAAAGVHLKKSARSKVPHTNPDMVAAVSGAKQPGPAELRFEIANKPEVGKPVEIHLELIPNSGVERMLATFTAGEGLELKTGNATPTYAQPEAGKSIEHTVTVVPKANGIFYVTATVQTDTETESMARIFTIPLIAGEGLSAVAQPAEPAKQSMASAPAANQRQSK